MHHPELPLFSFISALLVILPLSSHWRARNVPVLALISWLFISNIIYGINSIVWAGNIRNPVPVWCDISQWFCFDVCATTNIRILQPRKLSLGSHMHYLSVPCVFVDTSRWCHLHERSLTMHKTEKDA